MQEMQNNWTSAIETIKIEYSSELKFAEKSNDNIMHLTCCEWKENEVKSPINSEGLKDYKKAFLTPTT